jgi:hypothetical protein
MQICRHRDTIASELEAELQQFAMNAKRPNRDCPSSAQDQSADFAADPRSARFANS